MSSRDPEDEPGAPAPVPYVDLAAQNRAQEDELLEAVRQVLRHGHYILGPEVEAFERRIAARLGVAHAVGVGSGTDALVLALRAHHIGPGDEVIVPSHTYFATATAVALQGARPVFVDIDPETMLLDPAQVAEAIGPRTRAIIPVHLNGAPCDMDALCELCQAHDVALIEDAAQALGARWRGEHVGTFGTGCFSLHPLKILGALGDAGVVVTDDAELAARLRQLRTIGHVDRDHVRWVSGNARLDTLHAAMLLVKLDRLDEALAARRAHAAAYAQELPEELVRPAALADPRAESIFCPFVIRHPRRDALQEALAARGVDAKIHYPLSTHRQEAFSHLPPAHLPITDRVVSEILSLPSSAELTIAQRDRVIEACHEALPLL